MIKNPAPVEKNKIIAKARSRAGRISGGAVLVSEERDIFYLSGFSTESALMLFSKAGVFYFVDTMNLSLAKRILKGTKVSIVPGAPLEELIKKLKEIKARSICVDGANMPYAAADKIKESLKGVKLVSGLSPAAETREVKSAREISLLRHAARETVRIWNKVRREIRPGVKESEIATRINTLIAGGGYTSSFPVISAFGANTAFPHAVPTDKRLKSGEHGVFDFGLYYDGYASDLTRTWAEGRISRKIRFLLDAVNEAHDRCVKMLKPGLECALLAKKCDKFFIDKGLGKYIKHGLGHGVGLSVHERPAVTQKSGSVLKENMVITIEPGLYVDAVGGVRKEDMVLITKKGYEVLTQ